MVEYCLCRQWQDAQEIMEKVENSRPYVIQTSLGLRNYDAYECRYCGRLQFFRRRETDAKQEKLKVPA